MGTQNVVWKNFMGRPTHREEDTIKINLTEIGCRDVN
jgi:hypothetical protein